MEDIFGSYRADKVYDKYASAMSKSKVLNLEVEHLNIYRAKKEIALAEL